MKTVTIKFGCMLILLASVSLSFGKPAVRLTDTAPGVSGFAPIKASPFDALFDRLQRDETAIPVIKGNFYNSPPAAFAAETVLYHRTVTGGSATLISLVVGFLCVSLVRDRRVWVAAAYLLVVQPMAAEVRQFNHLAKTPIASCIRAASDLNAWHKQFTTPLQTTNPAEWNQSTHHKAPQIAFVAGCMDYNAVLQNVPQTRVNTDRIDPWAARLFASSIFSRPPPA